jgi:hypothetical protein
MDEEEYDEFYHQELEDDDNKLNIQFVENKVHELGYELLFEKYNKYKNTLERRSKYFQAFEDAYNLDMSFGYKHQPEDGEVVYEIKKCWQGFTQLLTDFTLYEYLYEFLTCKADEVFYNMECLSQFLFSEYDIPNSEFTERLNTHLERVSESEYMLEVYFEELNRFLGG